MTIRMLMDATHAEETRVVVADGKRLVEFDFETSTKKQIKGNIYLAKVVRVEPSLQAAFVDYGGNRHGFLAFNEVHPDYYRIPVADRRALIAEAEKAQDDAAEEDEAKRQGGSVETIGGDESYEIERAGEAVRRRFRSNIRQYKIQEVIKRRQILLVQVVKEERGTKGAALTTYLSLAGRYCVLMPNTARGGGISRKITSPQQRKRLKDILGELQVPDGMGVILRTAGVERSKAEIKRDYEYLRRQWDEIRDLTLKSTAPALIYEEGDIIKRSLRDIYSRDIDEVIVDGEDAYKTAKIFMKTMLPSHAKRVQKYADGEIPLFHRYQIESQLDEIHSPIVHLRSGGSIVINPTEALVSIDVNSGRATRERNIEETALQTNKEAAEEIARQLRLRDLAGLIVIDFIDMEDSRNNGIVERKLKEAMRNGRARIQVGRISPFGLLEMSRQRLRPSLVEAHTQVCPNCAGTGLVRSTESTALRVLRAIEEEGVRRTASELTVFVPTLVALYILNQKRPALTEIEARHGLRVFVTADDALVPPDYRMERMRTLSGEKVEREVVRPGEHAGEAAEPPEEDGKKRRRRRARNREDHAADATAAEATEAEVEAGVEPAAGEEAAAQGAAEERPGEARRRRRGRRGGRRRSRRTRAEAAATNDEVATPSAPEAAATNDQEPASAKPKRRRTRRRKSEAADAGQAGESDEPHAEAAPAAEAERPKRRRRARRTTRRSEDAAKDGEIAAEAGPVVRAGIEPVTTRPAEPAPEDESATRGSAAVASEIEAVMPAAGRPHHANKDMPAEMATAPSVTASREDSRRAPRKGWWNRILT